MKQLLPLFLFLLPCLAWAQYPSNGNQKITLGEQTTADGLIYRGVLADTGIITPSSDTSAYIILDTVNHRFYNYNRATNVWSVAGGGTAVTTFSAGTTGLTPNTATSGAVTLGGTLAVANGGTNLTSFTNNGVLYASSTSALATSSALTFDGGEFTFTRSIAPFFRSTESGTNITSYFGSYNIGLYLGTTTNHPIQFYQNSGEKMRLNNDGELTIGYGSTDNGAYKLQVNSQIFATNATIETSDIRFKENIQPLNKGLEIINKLKPVKFNFITTTENNFSEFDEIGFIAQDVEGALSTELFAKAVVKKLDEDKEDSALGLMTEKFIPILVKAIQEQQALIKALEQRIINLENK
jgi:hypothetical protein